VSGVARRAVVHLQVAADGAHHDFAGIQTHPDGERHPVRALHLVGVAGDRLQHAERGEAGADRVGLVHQRDAATVAEAVPRRVARPARASDRLHARTAGAAELRVRRVGGLAPRAVHDNAPQPGSTSRACILARHCAAAAKRVVSQAAARPETVTASKAGLRGGRKANADGKLRLAATLPDAAALDRLAAALARVIAAPQASAAAYPGTRISLRVAPTPVGVSRASFREP
jgi:hypothetical protein